MVGMMQDYVDLVRDAEGLEETTQEQARVILEQASVIFVLEGEVAELKAVIGSAEQQARRKSVEVRNPWLLSYFDFGENKR
jgi:hypothetical protein